MLALVPTVGGSIAMGTIAAAVAAHGTLVIGTVVVKEVDDPLLSRMSAIVSPDGGGDDELKHALSNSGDDPYSHNRTTLEDDYEPGAVFSGSYDPESGKFLCRPSGNTVLEISNCLPGKYRFNLPTEMQWEYACRAGTQTTYHSGNEFTDLLRVAWCKENSSGHTHPVGEKESNNWGLYDMHGNVAEWCYDSPSEYPKTCATNWIGQGDGNVRVLRGGSWGTPMNSSVFSCAFRGWVEPNVERPWIGFRVGLWSM